MLLRREYQLNQNRNIKRELQWLDGSFEYFLNSIPKHKLQNQLYMFSKDYSVSEAADRILNLSHVIMIENFANNIKKLGVKLGLTLKVLHADKPISKIEIPQKLIERLHNDLDLEYRLLEKLQQS